MQLKRYLFNAIKKLAVISFVYFSPLYFFVVVLLEMTCWKLVTREILIYSRKSFRSDVFIAEYTLIAESENVPKSNWGTSPPTSVRKCHIGSHDSNPRPVPKSQKICCWLSRSVHLGRSQVG